MKYIISHYVQFRLALKYVIKKYWHRKQNVLAGEAGISETMLSYVVKGKKEASLKKQVALAEAAGYSYEKFLALGRMIHQKVPPEKLPTPSLVHKPEEFGTSPVFSLDTKEDGDPYDENGGYSGHTMAELDIDDRMSQAVSKLMKIYDSGDKKIIRIVNRLLNEFCEVLEDNEDKKKA